MKSQINGTSELVTEKDKSQSSSQIVAIYKKHKEYKCFLNKTTIIWEENTYFYLSWIGH